MRNKLFFRLASTLLFMAVAVSTRCMLPAFGQVPQAVADALAKRDAVSEGNTFTYSVAVRNDTAGPEPGELKEMLAQTRERVVQGAKLRGKSGPTVQQKAAAEVVRVRSALTEKERPYKTTFQFSNKGGISVVSGQLIAIRDSSDLRVNMIEIYGEGWSMQVPEGGTVVQAGDPTPSNLAQSPGRLWGTRGQGAYYFAPIAYGFNLLPQETVVLLAKNPLGLFGAEWKLEAFDSKRCVLTTSVKTGQQSPYDIRMELDARHGYCPSRISLHANRAHMRSPHWYAEVLTTRFLQKDGVFFPAAVAVRDDRYGMSRIRRDWTFVRKAALEMPADMGIPANKTLIDYRLLGNAVTGNDIVPLEGSNRNLAEAGVAVYQWEGKMKSADELRKVIANQRARRQVLTADGASGGYLPLLGLCLLVVGTVVLVRRRRR